MLARALLIVLSLALALAPAASRAAESGPAPIEVMVVGDFPMTRPEANPEANPGQDLHNQVLDDVLAPQRQAELREVARGLVRFHPTKVAAEWPADIAADRYVDYYENRLPPSHNEVVQLAFRLAKAAGLRTVYGIDADGKFPYEPVAAFARKHGQSGILAAAGAQTEAQVKAQATALAEGGIAGELRFLNDPHRLAKDNAFYRETLRIGAGRDQPGAELLTAWYRRNFLICASLLQLARPGDRIVVFYGAGHAFLLRQCVSETPGFVLVEPNTYLPE